MDMKIKVEVECYSGSHRERAEIEITQEDIESLAERKAKELIACNSAKATDIEFTFNN